MATTTSKELQERLETEYPLLDTALLAALISDLSVPNDTSHEAIQSLHHMLSQLSLDAEVQQQQAESDARAGSTSGHQEVTSASSVDLRGSENGGTSPDDFSLSASGTSSTCTSMTSATPSTSPLEFLRLLFPNLSDTIVEQALREHSVLEDDTLQPAEDIDMSAVVDHLLTLEYIQDLTERGLEANSDAESDSGLWHTATLNGKHAASRPKMKTRVTMPFVDTRQRQHAPRDTHTKSISLPPSADPWTRLMSLATRLSELLQPTPAGFFMSYFHAPATTTTSNAMARWKREGDSLRAALSNLAPGSGPPTDVPEFEVTIEHLCNIVHNSKVEEPLLPSMEHSRIAADVRLCFVAASGDSATALDLVWLLRELDDAFDRGDGIAHSVILNDMLTLEPIAVRQPLSTIMSSPSSPSPPAFVPPAHPPPIPPPPQSQKHPPTLSPSRKDKGWTVVESRRPAINKHPHPHAEFIPAYSSRSARLRRTAKGSGNQFGKGGKGDFGELSSQAGSVAWYQARAGEFQNQRNEALREATRHWQRGNVRTRGGEVALYYAEKARKLREQQAIWALGAARMMVEEKRSTSAEPNTLDLHGLTVSEACVIVKEAIGSSPPSFERPLKVITGRGKHSVGHVGVLGPSVRELLRGEGWHVGKWDGGIVVRGKS